MTAYTMADHVVLAKGDDLTQGVIQAMLAVSPWFKRFPMRTIGTLSQRGVRTDTLPSVGGRYLNQPFSADVGSLAMFQEPVYPLGGLTDVDHLYAADKNVIENPRTVQQELKAESMIRTFADWLINGDRSQLAYAQAFDGIKSRISNLSTDMVQNGASLDLSTAANRAGANGAQFAYLMRVLIQKVFRVCGKVDALLMGDTALLEMQDVFQQQGYLKTTDDSYGRAIDTFMKAELVDVGFKSDLVTKIITDTHDGDSINTSIYAVALGEKFLQGLQFAPLKATDMGLQNDGVNMRTMVEWVVGLWGGNNFWGARLKGLKVV